MPQHVVITNLVVLGLLVGAYQPSVEEGRNDINGMADQL